MNTNRALPFIDINSTLECEQVWQSFDCIITDGQFIKKYDPDFISPDAFNHPLRIVVTKLDQVSTSWKIITDDYRRKTMIVTTRGDLLANSELACFLESKAVAVLALKENNEGEVDCESLFKSLTSLKFSSFLIEKSSYRLAKESSYLTL